MGAVPHKERLERVNPAFEADERVIESIAGSGSLPELDLLARELPEPELAVFSARIVAARGPAKSVEMSRTRIPCSA